MTNLHGSHWLISDLIPQKSEKFEFSKNFVNMHSSVKNWSRSRIFWIFRWSHFRKIAKEIQNLRVRYLPKNWKHRKTYFCEKFQNFVFWVSFDAIVTKNSEIRTFRIFWGNKFGNNHWLSKVNWNEFELNLNGFEHAMTLLFLTIFIDKIANI